MLEALADAHSTMTKLDFFDFFLSIACIWKWLFSMVMVHLGMPLVTTEV
jgi:hypothetical protein